MASIYKLGRDRKKKHAPWWISFINHTGKRKQVKGFTDKSQTEQLAATLEKEAHLRRTGMIDAAQEELAKQKHASLELHLAEFQKALSRRKNTTKHVGLTMSRVRRVLDGCGFSTLGQLSAERIEAFLDEIRSEEAFGHRTHNHYVQAIEQFCTWLVKTRRLGTNPVVGLTRLNCQTDLRHRRRALTQEEFVQLVQSASTSDKSIQCYSGSLRAMLYQFGYLTGLRRNELGSLTPSSFQLDGDEPTLTIAATISKHRRRDVLPLHPALATWLKTRVPHMTPEEPLFPKLARRKTWLMVKTDLERVGIPYVTAEGVADFHAAGRHTHITELFRNGATLAEAMGLARHSDVKMTMRYAHIGLSDQTRALAALPNPCQHIVSISGVSVGQSVAQPDSDRQSGGPHACDATPSPVTPSGISRQKKSPADTAGDLWRRRELNPRPESPEMRPLRVYFVV